MDNQIEFTKVKHDINGNPRYVCHFLSVLSDKDNESVKGKGDYKKGVSELDLRYNIALKKAKQLGGKKYHNKSYGGGIVFQSYNIDDLTKKIKELL